MSELIALQRDPSDPDIDGLSVVSDGLLPSSGSSYRLRHFPDEVWNLSPESSLVKFVKALVGDAGAGQIAKRILMARLQEAIQSTHFFDLDRFYGALFGLRRSSSERLTFDPRSERATVEEWEDAHKKDASYRSRIEQFARAITFGPTPLGMELIAEAVLGVDCAVLEVWRTANTTYRTWGDLANEYPTWGDLADEGLTWGDFAHPGDGLITPGLNRREFVIRPRRAITEAERYDLMRVLEQLKPIDAVVTVDPNGLAVHSPITPRAAMADSEYWEIVPRVVGQRAGTEQPYLVESSIPEEQPRSPFVGYQGEAWSYGPEVTAIQGYLETTPDEPVLVSGQPGLLAQRIDISGTSFEFGPRLAMMPKRRVLAGRYVSDGILASDPYASTRTIPGVGVYGDFYVDPQGRVYRADDRPIDAPVSGITADRVPLDQLLLALGEIDDADSSMDERIRFWATPDRPQGDPIREVLELRLASAKPVNYISFEAAHYPQSIQIQAWDAATGSWRIVGRHQVTDSVPAQPAHSQRDPLEHPQHFGSNHWVRVGGKLDSPVTSQRFRIVLQRADGTPPTARMSQSYAYAIPSRIVNYVWKQETFGQDPFREALVLATHQQVISSADLATQIGQNLPAGPTANGGWFIQSISDTTPQYQYGSYTVDTPVPYSLAVRGLDVGYRVYDRSDIPSLPSTDPIGSSQDMLGNKVEFYVRELSANNVIASTGVWKCDPQPISDAVVSLYVDTRDEDGLPQVIDRWYLEPIKPGARFNLYCSNDDPDADFSGADRDLPFGAWASTGTIIPESSGLRFSETDLSYIDVGGGPLAWSPSTAWWAAFHGVLNFHDTTERRVLFDLAGVQVWINSQQIVIAQPSGERAETAIAFRRGDSVSIVASHEPGTLRIVASVGGTRVDASAPYDTPLPSMGDIRIGGPLSSVSAMPAFVMRSFSLRTGAVTDEDLDAFFAAPGTFSQDRSNAILRFHPSFVGASSIYGLKGGPGVAFDRVVWRPIRSDYTLQSGFLVLPPTAAKYWKFEFTKLVPEPYEVFIPTDRRVRMFPPSVTLRQAQRELGGGATASSPGNETSQSLAEQIYYTDSVATITPPPSDTERLGLDVLVPDDPTAAARLRENSYALGYQRWHAGSSNPQWPETGEHRYEVVEIKHDQRVGYFVGLSRLQPHRVNFQTEDDTPVYVDHFDDLQWVSSNEWGWDGGRFSITDHEGVVKSIESVTLKSSSPVVGVQFSSQQSQPRQLLLDPDFRDGKLIGYSWDNTEYWNTNGSATALFDPATFSVKVVRSVIVGGVVIEPTHGIARPIVHEIGSSESITMPDLGGADASLGGISSELTQPSLVGQVWAAARFTALTDLETPLLLQIVTENGLVVSERRFSPQAGRLNEEYIGYTIGSKAPASQKLRVRLVQVGNTTDSWVVESIALFDEGVLWEFSVNGGETWTPALNVRNNLYGIVSFDRPGSHLRWRASGGRDGLHLTSLKIRPRYRGQDGPKPARPIHGPNAAPADVEQSIEDDPEFRQWSTPIPRSWFRRYQPVPTLRALALSIPDGEGPTQTDATVVTVSVGTASSVDATSALGSNPVLLRVGTSSSVPAVTVSAVDGTSPIIVISTVGTVAAIPAANVAITGLPTPAVVATTSSIPTPSITSVPDGSIVSRTSSDAPGAVTDSATRSAVMFRSAEE